MFVTSALGIGCVFVDTRKLEGCGIDENSVPSAMADQDRMIRRGCIKILAIYGTRSLAIVVQKAHNPLARRSVLGALANGLLNGSD